MDTCQVKKVTAIDEWYHPPGWYQSGTRWYQDGIRLVRGIALYLTYKEILNALNSKGRCKVFSLLLVTKPATARVTAWSAHLQTVANKLLDEPKESLASGSTLPWTEWMCLNRLRTGMGRCKHNMRKWGYSEEDTTCECQEAEQTMKHLLECPLLRQTCSDVDLIHYYEPAKECVKQWMGKV